jgi:endonuclease-3 related protein
MTTLNSLYKKLLNEFGFQGWWPTITEFDPEFEVIIGAILTQQATWKQVEKAIENLKKENLLSPEKLSNANPKRVQLLVRPSGFYKQKSKRIVNFSKYMMEIYDGNLKKFFNKPTEELRKELLGLDGIGKETADSILLYAADKLIFPIDAYTFRIFERIGLISEKENYDHLQQFIQERLKRDLKMYGEFHALLVKLGKTFCKVKPLCNECPIKNCNTGMKN